jgi:hypothetical protein
LEPNGRLPTTDYMLLQVPETCFMDLTLSVCAAEASFEVAPGSVGFAVPVVPAVLRSFSSMPVMVTV